MNNIKNIVKKLCVFPNDSLKSYYEKGEIKERYFNPKNWFDEVHVVSLFDEEIDDSKVEKLAGKGKLIIHKLGKANLSNFKSFEKKVITLVDEIKPDIIRAYNPLVQGWLAAKTSQKLKMPLVVSLHSNYEQQKEESKNSGKYFQYLKLIYTSKKIEKFVLINADTVICVYEFIVPYAKKMGAKNIHIIYNKIDLQMFTPNCKKEFEATKPVILSVGRLIDQKNQSYLVNAIKDLDVELLIIGNGPNYYSINDLVNSLKIKNKVKMIRKVPNEKLNGYYTASDVYAQPMVNLGGMPIPVLEAMACGLPVVMSKRENRYSEIIDEAMMFVNNDSDSFQKAFEKLLSDSEFRKKLCRKSLEIIKKISGREMEEKELNLYLDLL